MSVQAAKYSNKNTTQWEDEDISQIYYIRKNTFLHHLIHLWTFVNNVLKE